MWDSRGGDKLLQMMAAGIARKYTVTVGVKTGQFTARKTGAPQRPAASTRRYAKMAKNFPPGRGNQPSGHDQYYRKYA